MFEVSISGCNWSSRTSEKKNHVLSLFTALCDQLLDTKKNDIRHIDLHSVCGDDRDIDVFMLSQGANFNVTQKRLNISVYETRLFREDEEVRSYLSGRLIKAFLYAKRCVDPGCNGTLQDMVVANGLGLQTPVGGVYHQSYLPPIEDKKLDEIGSYFWEHQHDNAVAPAFFFGGNCDGMHFPPFGGFAFADALVRPWIVKQGGNLGELIHVPADKVVKEMEGAPLVPYWKEGAVRPPAMQCH